MALVGPFADLVYRRVKSLHEVSPASIAVALFGVIHRPECHSSPGALVRQSQRSTVMNASAKDSEPCDLHRLSEPIDALTTQLWLLTHPDLRHVARVRAFMEAITEVLRGG